MSEALDRLQKLGAQKIHEDTHIPIKHVQAILHGSFEGFTKVQFLGFVSILEKEYDLELEGLKESGEEFFVQKNITTEDDPLFVSQNQKKKKNTTALYAALTVGIFIVAIMISLFSSSESDSLEPAVDNSVIESVEKSIVVENNSSKDDENSTLIEVEKVQKEAKKEAARIRSFKIVPRTKVWFGYIDVGTNKHYQKTLKGEIELDPAKVWLLLFGHGHIDIYLNEELVPFKSHENLRFLYKNGTVKAISASEFKTLNRGRKW